LSVKFFPQQKKHRASEANASIARRDARGSQRSTAHVV
jgi:hypothetical protein